jgi:hypothetical protein
MGMITIHSDGEVIEEPSAPTVAPLPASPYELFDEPCTQLQEHGYEIERHNDPSGAIFIKAVPPIKKRPKKD